MNEEVAGRYSGRLMEKVAHMCRRGPPDFFSMRHCTTGQHERPNESRNGELGHAQLGGKWTRTTLHHWNDWNVEGSEGHARRKVKVGGGAKAGSWVQPRHERRCYGVRLQPKSMGRHFMGWEKAREVMPLGREVKHDRSSECRTGPGCEAGVASNTDEDWREPVVTSVDNGREGTWIQLHRCTTESLIDFTELRAKSHQ